ncbi:unnamed protein product [Cylicostephanus goldi]|uniref:Uncharacterized protein n=1 Tax=Cylicostephanus goldi TaxID=71465 RepID=A0A3P7MBC1_CYLGO|nr:unnamed protein product [Cylicostephanus goldi]
MKKCIDGTPLLTQLSGDDVVTACSHSGLVVCIRVRDGRCLWRTQINTRFEAPVARSGEYFVIADIAEKTVAKKPHTEDEPLKEKEEEAPTATEDEDKDEEKKEEIIEGPAEKEEAVEGSTEKEKEDEQLLLKMRPTQPMR